MDYERSEIDFKIEFAKNLRYLRIEEGFTQKQMANILNIPESTYGNWEQGRREPNVYQLAKIAYHLKINVNTLFEF